MAAISVSNDGEQRTAIELGRAGNDIGKANNHIEGGAQFVAHIGDKLGLGLARFFGHAFQRLESIRQTGQFAIGLN
jgi:hypothetical protein